MLGFPRVFLPHLIVTVFAVLTCITGCRSATPTPAPRKAAPAKPAAPAPEVPAVKFPGAVGVIPAPVFPVMLGIDVLESQGFKAVAGKRIGLLTHQAGVNRRGESTIDVLRRAPNTKLVCLFAPEHSLTGDIKASVNFEDMVDPRTKLPIYSLHGKNRKPLPAQLKGLDALVIDLQDIGVRSYTYNVVMRYAMESCFQNNVEVIILDRPNPLGGFKVDGPLLDKEWFSGVGAFRIPYVHGLTMGELARLAASEPGLLPEITEAQRIKGRLTIVPMRGWNRSMRWPDTGLKYIPTSPLVRDFPAVMGYAMVGLGCEYSGFKHGVGASYPFRGITFKGITADRLIRDLNALNLAGLSYRKVSVPDKGGPKEGVYVDVVDYNAWRPTELSFHLMRLACRYDPPNPFTKISTKDVRSFNIHVGSTAWWNALKRDGAKVDVEGNIASWRGQALSYQQLTRKYWLYQ